MKKPKRAKRITTALKQFTRKLKSGKPIKATRMVKAWGIFKQGVDAPLEVHSALFCDQASVEEFAKIRFPGWKNLRVQEITISYTVSLKEQPRGNE